MNSLLAPRRRRCSGDGGRMFAVPFASTAPGQPHAPPPVCTPRPLVPRSRADLYENTPLLYGTPTFDVSFKRALAAKQPKVDSTLVGSDPHSLPQCIAASCHESHATHPNPSRAHRERAQNPCKKHAAKAKTRCKPHGSRGRVPNLSHGGNATPSRATRCLVQQLRVATSCMARAPRVAARWKCCNKTARVRRRYN